MSLQLNSGKGASCNTYKTNNYLDRLDNYVYVYYIQQTIIT